MKLLQGGWKLPLGLAIKYINQLFAMKFKYHSVNRCCLNNQIPELILDVPKFSQVVSHNRPEAVVPGLSLPGEHDVI